MNVISGVSVYPAELRCQTGRRLTTLYKGQYRGFKTALKFHFPLDGTLEMEYS